MDYHHFSVEERIKIEIYREEGQSTRAIAQKLGRHFSSIARELNRCPCVYKAEQAQMHCKEQKQKCLSHNKWTKELAACIESKLQQTWSHEQIAGTVTKGLVSFKTIYRWLYQGFLMKGDLSTLRQKGKRRKKEKRGVFSRDTPISLRPALVESREEFGHWELDAIVSNWGKSKGCLATFIERKSRLYTAIQIPDRSSDAMKESIRQLKDLLSNKAFRTATCDRGKEFACYESLLKECALPLYFADPYSPWQRGSNENANGLLREFYPKKTDLATIDQAQLTNDLLLLNSRPRKCLNWKSPIHVFFQELSHLA